MNWKAVAGLLGLALVGSLVALGFAWGSSDGRAEQLARAATDAEAAARQATVSLTTYDWASLEEDFSWVQDAGTSKFQEYYAEVSGPIKKFITELKVKAEGTVVESAARAVDENRVTVLLFVDQTLTDEAGNDNQLDQPRVVMTMVRQDDRWLVDEVDIKNLTNN